MTNSRNFQNPDDNFTEFQNPDDKFTQFEDPDGEFTQFQAPRFQATRFQGNAGSRNEVSRQRGHEQRHIFFEYQCHHSSSKLT